MSKLLPHEATLSRDFVAALRAIPGAVVFKHNDATTAGIPDITFSLAGYTTWIEVKRGHPKGRRIQLHNMKHLEIAARAVYVIYTEDADWIVAPSNFDSFAANKVGWTTRWPREHPRRFNHKAIAEWLKERHYRAAEHARV